MDGTCTCPLGLVDRYNLSSAWCSTCEIAVPNITMSLDLKKITVEFGWNITVNGILNVNQPSEELCATILHKDTIATLGRSPPLCNINLDKPSEIIVELTLNPTIETTNSLLS